MPEPTVEERVTHAKSRLTHLMGLKANSVRIPNLTEDQAGKAVRLLGPVNPEYHTSVEVHLSGDGNTTLYDLIVSREG